MGPEMIKYSILLMYRMLRKYQYNEKKYLYFICTNRIYCPPDTGQSWKTDLTLDQAVAFHNRD